MLQTTLPAPSPFTCSEHTSSSTSMWDTGSVLQRANSISTMVQEHT